MSARRCVSSALFCRQPSHVAANFTRCPISNFTAEREKEREREREAEGERDGGRDKECGGGVAYGVKGEGRVAAKGIL